MSQASDRDEIRQLIATYTIEGDRGNVDRLAEAFAEDATMEIPSWRATGRAGIRKALGGGATSPPPQRAPAAASSAPAVRRILRHHLTSSLITFSGPDEASGRTYWINFSEAGPDHSGLYADKYERRGGRWFIVHREVRLDWKAPDSRLGSNMGVGPRPANAPPLPVITGD